LASDTAPLLPRRQDDGRATRLVANRVAGVADRLARSFPFGQGRAAGLAQSAEFIVAGYSDSRLEKFNNLQRRFVSFCELDGYDCESAGKHAMVAWIAFLFETTKSSGDSMRQYVSSINMAYETSGPAPPGRPAGTKCLYHEVSHAIHGFTNARLRAGGAEPTQHIPTPDTLTGLLCDFVQKVLSAPVSSKSLSLARNALSNVCVAILYDIAPDYNGRYGMERSPAGI
jgi:hypothetical protein